MEQGVLDVLIALLQSMVVLLLASGVYVALAVRKTGPPRVAADAEPAAPPRGPTSVT